MEKGGWNLEGVLIALRFTKVFGDLTEVGDGNAVAFTNPSVEDIGGASFREPKPHYSSLQIIIRRSF